MTGVVIDCSVTMAWLLDDEAEPIADRIFSLSEDIDFVVPIIWQIEVANILWAAIRRKRITRDVAYGFATVLRKLDVRIDRSGPDRALTSLLELAQLQRITVYDASYLELADRLGMSIATLDKGMRRAASDMSLAFYEP